MHNPFFIDSLEIPSGKQTLKTGSYYGILWILRGNLTITQGQQTRQHRQEEVFLIKPVQTLFLYRESTVPSTSALFLRISPSLLQRLSDTDTDFLAQLASLPLDLSVLYTGSSDSALTKNMAKKLLTEVQKPGFGSPLFLHNMISLILVILLRLYKETIEKKSNGPRRKFMLDDIFAFIKTHLDEPIPLMRLEQEFYISHEHIAREFRKQTGETIHRYILKLRLEQSCQCLQNGESISQTWQSCGFNSYSYFHQAFHNYYGVTPKAYQSGGS